MGTASEADVKVYLSVGKVLKRQWEEGYDSKMDENCAELEGAALEFLEGSEHKLMRLVQGFNKQKRKGFAFDTQLSESYLWSEKVRKGTNKEKHLASLQDLHRHLRQPLPQTAAAVERCITAHMEALLTRCDEIEKLIEGAPGQVRRLEWLRAKYIAADPRLSLLQDHGALHEATVDNTAGAEAVVRDKLNTEKNKLTKEEAELKKLLVELGIKIRSRGDLLIEHKWTDEEGAKEHKEELEMNETHEEAELSKLCTLQRQFKEAQENNRKRTFGGFSTLSELETAIDDKNETVKRCKQANFRCQEVLDRLQKINTIPEGADDSFAEMELQEVKMKLEETVKGLREKTKGLDEKLSLLCANKPVSEALQVLQDERIATAKDLEIDLKEKKRQVPREESRKEELRQLAPHLQYLEDVVEAGVDCERAVMLRNSLVTNVKDAAIKKEEKAVDGVKEVRNMGMEEWDQQALDSIVRNVDDMFKYLGTLPSEYKNHVRTPSLLLESLAELHEFLRWNMPKDDEATFARYCYVASRFSLLGSATQQPFTDICKTHDTELQSILKYETPSVVDDMELFRAKEKLELYSKLGKAWDAHSRGNALQKTMLRSLTGQIERRCTAINSKKIEDVHDMWREGSKQMLLVKRAEDVLTKGEQKQLQEKCDSLQKRLSSKFKDTLNQLRTSNESCMNVKDKLDTFEEFYDFMTPEVAEEFTRLQDEQLHEANTTLDMLKENGPQDWNEMLWQDLKKAEEEKNLPRSMVRQITENVNRAFTAELEKGTPLDNFRKVNTKLRKMKTFEPVVDELDARVNEVSSRRDKENLDTRSRVEQAVKLGSFEGLESDMSESTFSELKRQLRVENIEEKIISHKLEARHVLLVLHCERYAIRADCAPPREFASLEAQCKRDFSRKLKQNWNDFVFWVKFLGSRCDQELVAQFLKRCGLERTLEQLLSTFKEMEKTMCTVLGSDSLEEVEGVAEEWKRSFAVLAAGWVEKMRPLLASLQGDDNSCLATLRNVDEQVPDWEGWRKKVSDRVDRHLASLTEKGKELAKPSMETQDSVARKDFYVKLTKDIKALESFTAAGARAVGHKLVPDVQAQLMVAFSDLHSSVKRAVESEDWVLVNQVVGNLESLRSCPAKRVSDVACSEHAKVVRLLEVTMRKYKNLEGTDRVECLVKLYQMADGVEVIREMATKAISTILTKFTKDKGPKKLSEFAEELRSHTSGTGEHLVKEHSVFKAENRRLFNENVGRRDINVVLTDLETKNKMPKEHSRLLQTAHEDVMSKFFQFVRGGCTHPKDSIDKLITAAKDLGSKLRQKRNGGVVNWAISLFEPTEKDLLTSIVAHITAIWSLMASDGSSNTDEHLRKPHAVQVVAILCGLGWTSGGFLNGSFVQVGTGEGKSVVLAVLAAVCGLLGVKPYVVCYSSYLSRRDEKDFKELLTALGADPFYGTFNECCEDVLMGKSLREEAEALLLTRSCSKRKAFSNASKRCLLIDEVDVFLDESFYGQQYLPSLKLDAKGLKGLTDQLWEGRGTMDKLTWEKVKKSEEYKKAVAVFAGFKSLFEEAVRSMIADLKYYKSGPKWTVDEEQLKDGTIRIGYVDQDAVDYTKVYEYGTLWALYEEYRKDDYPGDKEMREQKLAEALYLQFKLGQYSYTHLAMEEFKLIVGVSGTLPKADSAEAKVVREFGIVSQTVMPSMYGGSNLVFKKAVHVNAEETGNVHFAKLMQEVKEGLQGGKRSVLVLFETEKQVDDYMKRVGETEDEAFVRKMQRMVEGLTHDERVSRTRRATTPGVLTFATRVYGRGIDFIVTQKEMLDAGGLHVVQTFMGPMSEHLQIKGRAARQGQPGSFSMLVDIGGLDRFDISREQALEASRDSKLYDLVRKSKAFYAKDLSLQSEEMRHAKEDHDSSMAFRRKLSYGGTSLGGMNRSELVEKLVEWNKGPREAMQQASKTVILLDGTGSMTHLIHGAKAVLRETFKRVYSILEEAKKGSFSIQIGVYRNYNRKLFECSKWCDDAGSLYEFLQCVRAEGGWGEEAVEAGLQHVNGEAGVTQVILMGDAPANSAEKLQLVKSDGYTVSTDWETETRSLIDKEIPVHAFYLARWAKENFKQIASRTGGQCKGLDVSAAGSSDVLMDLWSVQVLRDIGGDELEAMYKRRYATGSHTEGTSA